MQKANRKKDWPKPQNWHRRMERDEQRKKLEIKYKNRTKVVNGRSVELGSHRFNYSSNLKIPISKNSPEPSEFPKLSIAFWRNETDTKQGPYPTKIIYRYRVVVKHGQIMFCRTTIFMKIMPCCFVYAYCRLPLPILKVP